MMINPKWLATFTTLAENKSFTQTAEKLYMTQPGVSQHIKKLENAIGEEIIFRQGKQFELTQAGIALLAFIDEQQRHLAQFLTKIKQDSPVQGEIRLACSGAMAMKLYTSLLAHQKSHPELSVYLEAAPESRILFLLEKNQIDIGICTQKIDHHTFSSEKIGEEAISVILPKTAKSVLNFSSLAKLGFINHPDAKLYADLVLGKNFSDEYRGLDSLPIHGYVNQLAQILLPVAQGLGFTLLPQSVLENFNQKDKLTELTLKKQVSLPLYLVQKRHLMLPARYKQVLALIKALCQ